MATRKALARTWWAMLGLAAAGEGTSLVIAGALSESRTTVPLRLLMIGAGFLLLAAGITLLLSAARGRRPRRAGWLTIAAASLVNLTFAGWVALDLATAPYGGQVLGAVRQTLTVFAVLSAALATEWSLDRRAARIDEAAGQARTSTNAGLV